jgi:hypothetical protein
MLSATEKPDGAMLDTGRFNQIHVLLFVFILSALFVQPRSNLTQTYTHTYIYGRNRADDDGGRGDSVP